MAENQIDLPFTKEETRVLVALTELINAIDDLDTSDINTEKWRADAHNEKAKTVVTLLTEEQEQLLNDIRDDITARATKRNQ